MSGPNRLRKGPPTGYKEGGTRSAVSTPASRGVAAGALGARNMSPVDSVSANALLLTTINADPIGWEPRHQHPNHMHVLLHEPHFPVASLCEAQPGDDLMIWW